ncbi:hypothetical protein [Arenimonas daejeonensis]|uniref:hypothetical protein n=1 Tax=Arenimonas daejeonensis TaxID=370777 RepID=UPI0011BE5F96|nr:hypothetical protein [Arenimonas daejeonensis]
MIALSLRSYAPDERFADDLRQWSEHLAARFREAGSMEQRHLLFQQAATGWMAAYTGDVALAQRLLERIEGHPLIAAYPANAAMQRVLQAEIFLASGKPSEAVAVLAPDQDDANGLYFSRAVLMRALAAAGKPGAAAEQTDWLASHRGRAFAEFNSRSGWQAANVIESNLALRAAAQLAERAGQKDRANKRTEEFSRAWPGGEALEAVKRRDATL